MYSGKHSAYSSLQSAVESGRLRMISIISPPRSSSTALERLLLESPGVSGQSNEPWSVYDDPDREEQAYQRLWSRCRELEIEKHELVLVVKNIADFIWPGEYWSKWLALQSKVVFLIRNPFLTLESLTRQLARDLRGDREFGMGTLDDFARARRFKSWRDLYEDCCRNRAYSQFDPFWEEYLWEVESLNSQVFVQAAILAAASDERLARYSDKPRSTLQELAQVSDWDELIADVSSGVALNFEISELIKALQRFRVTGWEALADHMLACQKEQFDYRVVDSTLLRAYPESVLELLCQYLEIPFSSSFIDWSVEGSNAFDKGYQGFDETPFYDRVLSSSGIQPPTESLPALDSFPACLQQHLLGMHGALDIYIRALFNPLLIHPNSADVLAGLSLKISAKSLEQIDPLFAAAVRLRCGFPADLKQFPDQVAKILLEVVPDSS